MFLTFTSLKNSWTGAFSFTLHLHVDTPSFATVGVGLPILATHRLVYCWTHTPVAGADAITVHLDAKILGQAAIGVGYSILPTHRLEDYTPGFPFTNPEEHHKSNKNSPQIHGHVSGSFV